MRVLLALLLLGVLASASLEELKQRALRTVPKKAKPLQMPVNTICLSEHEHLRTTGPFNYDCSRDEAACPKNWGSLQLPEGTNNQCGSRNRQSPIDLPLHEAASYEGGSRLQIGYKAFPVSGSKIFNNGHTVEVLLPKDNAGNSVAGGLNLVSTGFAKPVSYSLEQFHIHSPSEHTINGESFPLEVHLVHKKGAGQNDGEPLLVVSFLFTTGPSNYLLSKFFDKLPAPPGANEEENVATLTRDARMDLLNELVRHTHLEHYYTYLGSLTTPPCTEAVKWWVVSDFLTVSTDQVAAFRKVLPEGSNNRPVQPNGALVKIRRGYA
jgi:carbonic anhydrase